MNKNIKLTYLKKAQKFLQKNQNIITESDVDELIIKAIKKVIYSIDINLDLKYLKGEYRNKLRIRKGKIRIIFEIVEDEVIIESIIENIDFRGDVY
jgi:mRNA-degrading endonuclease RelE of RelBE toxin-antitoxin system